ncbi:MAG: DnaJ domain-containing protein [Pseudomonadota bacterium]
MNVYDAAKILSVSGDVTPKQVKAAYVAACKKYHPDINPAGAEMMKVINAAFDVLRDYSGTLKDEQSTYGEHFNDALNAVFSLSGLSVEICGVWLWVTGETRQYKDVLKGAGFKWAHEKKAWYFRPEQHRSFSRGSATLEEIREKYGSKRPQGSGYTRLGGAA